MREATIFAAALATVLYFGVVRPMVVAAQSVGLNPAADAFPGLRGGR